jgi:hypothetical protein
MQRCAHVWAVAVPTDERAPQRNGLAARLSFVMHRNANWA